MRARTRQTRRVVIDLRQKRLALALAETAGDAVRFYDITRIEVPDEVLQRQDDDIVEFLGETLRREVEARNWQGMPAACLLSGEATSTQSFQLPDMPRPELQQAIELRLSDTLHFDVEEAIIDFRWFEGARASGVGSVLVAAVQRAAADRAVRVMRLGNLRPVSVGAAAESLACLSAAGKVKDDREAMIHVTIGDQASIINLFEGRHLRFSREIEISFSSFVEALTRPILMPGGAMQLDGEQARKLLVECGYPTERGERELSFGVTSSQLQPLLEPIGQRLCAEIERSSDYLCSLLERTRVHSIVLSGAGSRLNGLDRMLMDRLRTPVTLRDPVAEAIYHWRLAVCGDEAPAELSEFAAILGMSLGSREPINLLPQTERLQQQVERVSRVRNYATAPLIALLAIIGFSAWPVYRTLDEARDMATEIHGRMESRIFGLRARQREHQSLESDHTRLVNLRGAVVDWTGLFRELSSVLPSQAVLKQIEVEWVDGNPQLALEAYFVPGLDSFGRVASEVSAGLSASPFFLGTSNFEADPPGRGRRGTFQAGLPIAAWSPLAKSGQRVTLPEASAEETQ